jgi:hypothetical protein
MQNDLIVQTTSALVRSGFRGCTIYIVTCMSDHGRGFGLDIGFIDHFTTQLVISLNYSAIADLYTSQIPVTHSLLLYVSW